MNTMDVRAEMARILGKDPDALPAERQLADVTADSFQLVELVVELSETTGVQLGHEDLRDARTVGDLVRIVAESAASDHSDAARPRSTSPGSSVTRE